MTLLSLVIFIFYHFILSNTYNSVQANANQIWKFQRYYLVMEYAQRPVLVPPFIILNHVIHLIKGLYRWLKNCRRRSQNQADCTRRYGISMILVFKTTQHSLCMTYCHATLRDIIRVISYFLFCVKKKTKLETRGFSSL